jgi:hypothetical protein
VPKKHPSQLPQIYWLIIITVYTIIACIMSSVTRRGRPPKLISASETLSPIRVTPEQKALYKKAADEAQLSVSAWIKSLADKEIKKAR